MNHIKKFSSFFMLVLLFAGCAEEVEKPKEVIVAKPVQKQLVYNRSVQIDWIKSANVYEVNIRQYTPEGTLKAFEKHLPRLKEMGADILLFLPIQPIGKKNRNGELGNYYSISDYDAVHPDYGTEEEFTAIVKKAHDLGMKVVLDWQANHTSFDHIWTKNRADFYTGFYEGEEPKPVFDDRDRKMGQSDIADLNYEEADLEGAMIESMRYWILVSDIDGFRCMDADLVPIDFWQLAMERIQQTKDSLLFIAESIDPIYLQLFDAGYGNALYQNMLAVNKGEKELQSFESILADLNSIYPSDVSFLNFTSTNRLSSKTKSAIENFGEKAKNYFVLAATFQGGIPLIMGGQEASLNKSLPLSSKSAIDWNGEDLSAFYKSILELKRDNQALWSGSFGGRQARVYTGKDEIVYAYLREKDGNRVIVFLNFSGENISFQPNLTGLSGDYKKMGADELVKIVDKPQIEIEPYGHLILTI